MEIVAKLVQFPTLTDVTYAAPSAEEILERLPDLVKKDGKTYYLKVIKKNDTFLCDYYTQNNNSLYGEMAKVLAEAAGKC